MIEQHHAARRDIEPMAEVAEQQSGHREAGRAGIWWLRSRRSLPTSLRIAPPEQDDRRQSSKGALLASFSYMRRPASRPLLLGASRLSLPTTPGGHTKCPSPCRGASEAIERIPAWVCQAGKT